MQNVQSVAPAVQPKPLTALSARIPIVTRQRLGGDFFKRVPVAGDALLITLSFALGRPIEMLLSGETSVFPWTSVAIYSTVLIGAMYLGEMYSFWHERRTAELIASLVRTQLLALVVVAPVLYWFPEMNGRWFLGVTLTTQFCLLFCWRTVLERFLITQLGRQRILIIGSGDRARRIREALQQRGEMIFELVGCTVDRTEGSSSKSFRRLGASVEVSELARREHIDHIVVAQDNPRNVFPAEALLRLKHDGVGVSDGEFFYERLMGKILTDYARPSALIFTAHPMHHTLQIWMKNVIDFTVALVLLFVTLPITAAAAILIKLTSKGPIFYSQERVGIGGRPFTIYKFRSMRTDAEKDGIKWAQANDSRVTWIGKIMRRTRIDELPQLINILKGNMSMVGPRPERPPFVKKLKQEIPYYEMRHMMRPGLSGWAQVRYRYGSSIEDAHEKLRYDLYYIKNYSIFIDLTVLLETIKVVVLGSGAR